MKKENVDKKHKVVKKDKAVKKHKAVRRSKAVKKDKVVKKSQVKDITEYEWKMKSNVHVRILSESKYAFNPQSKILYASKAEVEELEKEDDTLVITISFEGDIKDDLEDISDESVKI